MKIMIILGSPKKRSSSTMLAEHFAEGARRSGHDVEIFDSAQETVNPCKDCNYCKKHNDKCIQNDAITPIFDKLINSDLIVFATPLHYFSFSAQIKCVMSRFHAINADLRGDKGAVLLVTSSKTEDWALDGIKQTYKAILQFLDWKDQGSIFAIGCRTFEQTEKSRFPDEAYELGKSIGKDGEHETVKRN